jgi:hypothetical protein
MFVNKEIAKGSAVNHEKFIPDPYPTFSNPNPAFPYPTFHDPYPTFPYLYSTFPNPNPTP